MALARVKTWVSAETLTASDLNAEYNNILNYLNGSGVTLTSPVLTTPSVTGLLDISGGTSGQIKFPATQNASSDANTLDDYEEGTWTPSLGGNTTYNNQIGTYTKVGRLVTINMFLNINAIGTGSATTVSGLPFAAMASTTRSLTPGAFTTIATSVTWLGAVIASGASTISFTCLTAAAASITNTPNVFQNSAQVSLSGSYETT